MRITAVLLLPVIFLTMSSAPKPEARLVIVDPGHFHATLLQKEMYPQLSSRVSVYAPLGPELLDYLNRVQLFNSRAENPTRWELEVHAGPDSMARMLRERPGNVVVFTGRNRGKIDRVIASVDAGLNVLADKPWIISSDEMPKLERALDIADRKRVAAYDIMTERYEITSILQRELVNDAGIFGKFETGTADDPAVKARSVHHLMKQVAGLPLRRPAWFFDIAEYGEGLADVGTHVVDLVQWTAFPDQAIDYRKDIGVLHGRRWPTKLTVKQFQQVTGEAAFPAALAANVHNGVLDYYCNNFVHYTLRGIHVAMDIIWNWEAPEGTGDVYEASFRGSKASVEIRQGAPEKFRTELYVVPRQTADHAPVLAAVRKRVDSLAAKWPGLTVEESAGAIRILIPEKHRVGHEAHFAQVTNRFFDYLNTPGSMPAWEKPNMLAKYYVTTKGVELGRSFENSRALNR